MSKIFRRSFVLNARKFGLLVGCRAVHISQRQASQAQLPQLSPYDVNQILRENEYSYIFPETDSVVISYESNQLGSNNPCEDTRTEATFLHKNGFISGVFDGHAGAACGQVVSKRLLRYIAAATINRDKLREELASGSSSQAFLRCHNDKVEFVKEIKDIYEESFKSYAQSLSSKEIRDTATEIQDAFLRLDGDLSKEALNSANLRTLAVAISGAVALVAKIEDNNLYVANTGDCGAVLGSLDPETGKWISKKVSIEHNTDNSKEVERILKQHPPEERDTAIKNNRLLGQLAPLRAFGDFRYKWSNEILQKLVVPILGENAFAPHYNTPPYLTAEPDVQHHVLGPNDKFLVIATDGLWDFLSASDVVNLVGEHIKAKKILEPLKLPDGDVTLQKISRILRERKAGLTSKPLDSNTATHLIRQALGATDYGIEHSKLAYYLSLPQDIVRYYRDDITVTVVYFNSEQIAKLSKVGQVPADDQSKLPQQ